MAGAAEILVLVWFVVKESKTKKWLGAEILIWVFLLHPELPTRGSRRGCTKSGRGPTWVSFFILSLWWDCVILNLMGCSYFYCFLMGSSGLLFWFWFWSLIVLTGSMLSNFWTVYGCGYDVFFFSSLYFIFVIFPSVGFSFGLDAILNYF